MCTYQKQSKYCVIFLSGGNVFYKRFDWTNLSLENLRVLLSLLSLNESHCIFNLVKNNNNNDNNNNNKTKNKSKKQNKTKQNKTKQKKTKQNKTKS